MKTIKMAVLATTAAMVALAIAVPATASAANWKKDGKELTQTLAWYEGTTPIPAETSETFSASGSFNFSSGAECSDVDFSALLVGGPGEVAGITKFAVDPSSCTLIGTLKSVGCTTVNSVTYDLPNGAALLVPKGNEVLAVTNTFSLTYDVSGSSFCNAISPVTISGNDMIATADDGQSIGSLTFSGTLDTSWSTTVVASGTVNAEPQGAYGFDTAHSVALGDRSSVNFDFSLGSCPVEARLALDPGSTGRVTAVDWHVEACSVGSHLKTLGCQVTDMTTGGLPWTATDEGTSIGLSGIEFTMHYNCPGSGEGSRTFTGSLSGSPDDASAISETTFSGTLDANGTQVSAEAVWDWDPAGVFGL